MNKKPLVSIGMPVFNGDKYLRETFDSLLKQSFSNFELIVSDDASTDSTEKICKEYALKDKRIRYEKQKQNRGFAENFNFVLNESQGDYFMWAGQDDLWDKDFIKTLTDLLQKDKDAVLAMSNYQNLFKNKKYFVYKQKSFDNKWNTYQSLIYFLKTTNLSLFYGLHKTNAIKKVGGYHTDFRPLAKSSDYVTIFRVLLQGRMVYTPEVLFYKRDTGHYTNRHNLIKQNLSKKTVLKKIGRFLLYPFFYILDEFFCFKYLLNSNLNLHQKVTLSLYISISFLKRMRDFLLDIVGVII